VTLPGTDGGGVRVGDGVEAFDVLEGEVVDEADSAAVVGVGVSLDELHINGTRVSYRTLMTRIGRIGADFFLITCGYFDNHGFNLWSSV